MSSFVLAGGLHTLCSLFTHANPVVRMKAITTLVSITAHKDFDWFTPPPRVRSVSLSGKGAGGSTYANNTTDARLHRALLGLRLDPVFISGLIANSWGGGGAGGEGATKAEAEVDGQKMDGNEKGGGGGGGRKDVGKAFPGGCLMCLEVSRRQNLHRSLRDMKQKHISAHEHCIGCLREEVRAGHELCSLLPQAV